MDASSYYMFISVWKGFCKKKYKHENMLKGENYAINY